MKMTHRLILFLLAAAGLFSCSNQQQAQAAAQSSIEVKKLTATEFSDKIKKSENATILDVRSADEYKEGHISDSKNIDWNSSEFKSQATALDKSKPLFVYCLSGARSAAAAEYFSKNGFNQIYELDGGMLKWRTAQLAEVSDSTVTSMAGMTVQQFEELLKTDKYVLVDFYATWCGPCKQMEPALKEISETMGDKVEIVRIDTDQNEELSKHFEIEFLPTIKIYKNQKLVWENEGAQTKEQLIKHLK